MSEIACGLIWIITGLLAAGGFFIPGYLYYRKWKVMSDTPTRMIVDIEPGRVEINGRVEPVPGGILGSPLTMNSCVRYNVMVQEYRHSKNSSYWATTHSNKRGGPFILKDASGRVVVDPGKEKIEMVQTYHSNEGPYHKLDAKAREYIDRTGISTKGPFGVLNLRLRVIEQVLPINKSMYALGDAVDEPNYRRFQSDPITSPFTIMKKKMLIISSKGEEDLASSKFKTWLVLYIMSGLSAFFGLLGIFFFFI